LTGHSAGFEGQRLAAQLDLYFLHVEHLFFLTTPAARCGGGL
jgi:hypothetical protein